MTQEQANKIFETDLGQQLDVIYVTSDDKTFIRYEEVKKHIEGKLDPAHPNPLENKIIKEYYNPY